MNIGNRSRALREVRNLLQGDMDESVLEQRLQDAEKLTQKGPVGLTDLQRLLEDKSIDAISIAAPNHSHALQTIWGRQAGKDAYVERPCAHNIFEAKQALAAPPSTTAWCNSEQTAAPPRQCRKRTGCSHARTGRH